MNKVTYLAHSGFAVTLDNVILVFDYSHDPAHALHKLLKANPDKQVVFFVTHRHKDHFKPDIFEIAQNHRCTYVISNDVPAKQIPSGAAVAGMSPNDYIENLPGNITVKAYKSTDEGVAFLVTTPSGEKIFHAGDLNDWQWMDEDTPRQAEKAHNLFVTIINRIKEEHPQIDGAFFPVDVRLGQNYASGAKYFLNEIEVTDFFPMHFNGDYKKACDFADYAPARTTCHCLRIPGESINLAKETVNA